MCRSCWVEYGEPRIANVEVSGAVIAIRAVYDFSLVGGALHAVLDDWNLDDRNVDYSEKYARKNTEDENQLAVELVCVGLLKRMSVEERASALALYEGFWEREDE